MVAAVRCTALVIALLTSLAAPVFAQSGSGQLSTPKSIDLNTMQCHDLLDASLLNRGFAIMMYFGYEAAKKQTTKFSTATLRANAQKLTDYCAAHPKTPVFNALGALGMT